MQPPTPYLTPETLAFVGREVGPLLAPDPVERGAIRRFIQATGSAEPLHWDDAYAATTRFGAVVAPPLFPLYQFHSAAEKRDELAEATDLEFDGITDNFIIWFGLPRPPLPLSRYLNGGISARVYRYARLGERIVARSRFTSIVEKQGGAGPLIIVVIRATFSTEEGLPLLACDQTLIFR